MYKDATDLSGCVPAFLRQFVLRALPTKMRRDKAFVAHSQIVGLLMVGAAGILSGIVAWPIKHMRRFRYEHWAFVGNFVALVLLPWSVLLAACPQAIAAFSHLPWTLILKANLFTLAWGVANVLVGLCLVRIGISLTIGLMMGVGLPIGVLVPMILRGSGIFAHAPELHSPAGAVMLAGVVVILAAIYFTTAAGFGRDNLIKRQDNAPGKFGGGFVMTVLAGFLQVGLSFAFVYTQSDIVKSLQGVERSSRRHDYRCMGDRAAGGRNGEYSLSGVASFKAAFLGRFR